MDAQKASFENLLEYLKQNRGFDFTGYKRSGLTRRIDKRMQIVGAENYNEYLDFLEVHPDEFAVLFNTILINVSGFFRDQTTWDVIQREVVPAILAKTPSDQPIRVWSAGCANGEEPYTIAMVLAEAMGIDQFRQRVKIYATDIDDEALEHARQAIYTSRDMTPVPTALRDKYFEQNERYYIFRKDFRRSVIFGRHDLLQDAPISRVNLLLCRNTLMYFNAEAQNRLLTRFNFALAENAFLYLGKAEMLLTHGNLFIPFDLKSRIFTKVTKIGMRDRLLTIAQAEDEENAVQLAKAMRFREAASDANPIAQIVVDLNGFVALANERARIFFNLTARDTNRSLQDLELSYRIANLLASIEETYNERRPTLLKDVQWATTSGEIRELEVQIVPLSDVNGLLLGVSITFTDLTRFKRLQQELEHANQELETAYEELHSTVEELETTNEELQSTVEELETTNEELQSTNEELETMNEELQSTNEELQTINEELRQRTEELNQVNLFLESILTHLRLAIVVIDRNLQIQVWSRKAEILWGLTAKEAVNNNFFSLDIGLPVDKLKQEIRDCLAQKSEHQEVILSATNRRGKPIRCRVNCTTLKSSDQSTRGAILVIEELDDTPSQYSQ